MPRSAARIRAKTQKILQSLSVERQDFGGHWDEIKRSRYDGSLSDDGLDKLCVFIHTAKRCGIPADEFSRRQMIKPLTWRFRSIERKSRKLCIKLREKMASRQRVVEHHPPSDNENAQDRADRPEEPAGNPADDQTNRSVTVDNPPRDPPVVAVGQNSLDGYQSITYQHWLGPDDMRLREQPPTKQNQVMLHFAIGPALFPKDLLEASAEERYNFHETVVCFDKESSVAQVPASIPEPYRAACINKVRSCNPRLKPSNQDCYESIVRCLKHRLPFHLTDLIAMFTFVHYVIGETGRNRWLWQKMKLVDAERFCDPGYQWNIVNGVVRDEQGQSLAHLVTTRSPPALCRRKGRSQIGSKMDRAKFQRRILHSFQGYNEDGIKVYKTYFDKYLANEAAIAKLRQDNLDIATNRDEEERRAREVEERSARD